MRMKDSAPRIRLPRGAGEYNLQVSSQFRARTRHVDARYLRCEVQIDRRNRKYETLYILYLLIMNH